MRLILTLTLLGVLSIALAQTNSTLNTPNHTTHTYINKAGVTIYGCGHNHKEATVNKAAFGPASCSALRLQSYGSVDADVQDCTIPTLPVPSCGKYRLPIVFTIYGADLNYTFDSQSRPVPTGAPADIYTKIEEELAAINAYFANFNVEAYHAQAIRIPSTIPGFSAAEAADLYNYNHDASIGCTQTDNDDAELLKWNVPNAININLINNPKICGNIVGGYSPVGGGIERNHTINRWQQIGAGQKAVIHELGHFLGLWHTHNNMEGEAGFLTETADKADNSTCASRGDRICDTEPDPYNLGPADQACGGGYYENGVYINPDACVQDDEGNVYGDMYNVPTGNVMSYWGNGQFTACQYRKMYDALFSCLQGFCAKTTTDFFVSENEDLRFKSICLGEELPVFEAKEACMAWYASDDENPISIGTQIFNPADAGVSSTTAGVYEFYVSGANEYDRTCREKVVLTIHDYSGAAEINGSNNDVELEAAMLHTVKATDTNIENPKVIGWWLTEGSPVNINNYANAELLQIAMNEAFENGEDFEAGNNIIRSNNDNDNTTTDDELTFNCDLLDPEKEYYLTPFGSGDLTPFYGKTTTTAIPDESNRTPKLLGGSANGLIIPINVTNQPTDAIIQKVHLNIDYNNVNDLTVILQAPTGGIAVLVKNYNSTGSDINGTFINQNLGGYSMYSTACNGSAACLEGNLETQGWWNNITNINPNGEWKLHIYDNGNSGIIGSLENIELEFDNPRPIFPSVPFNTCAFGESIKFTCGQLTPLPVELTYFKGENQDDINVLSWETATELNNEKFILERSSNGLHYETVAEVKGAGTTTEIQNYNYTDNAPYQGLNYYRLSQIDTDGQIKAVGLITLNVLAKKNNLKAYPNPVRQQFNVKYLLTEVVGDVVLSIYDIRGQLILKEVKSVTTGENDFIYNVQSYPSGLYILEIKSNNDTQTLKFVKE